MCLWCALYTFCLLFFCSQQVVYAELYTINVTVQTPLLPKIHHISSQQFDIIMLEANHTCSGFNWYITNGTRPAFDRVDNFDVSEPVYRVDLRLYLNNSRLNGIAKVSEDIVVLSCKDIDTVVILRYDQQPLSTRPPTALVPTSCIVQPTPTDQGGQDALSSTSALSGSNVINTQPITVTTAGVISGSVVLLIVAVPLVLVILWLVRRVTKAYAVAGTDVARPIEMDSGQHIAEQSGTCV